MFSIGGASNVGTVFTPLEDDESKAEEDTVKKQKAIGSRNSLISDPERGAVGNERT